MLYEVLLSFIKVLFVGGDVIASALDKCEDGSFRLAPIGNW